MNTQENNKMIAEFMGLAPNECGVYQTKRGPYHLENLSYNLSWDWLMPVVEKIYSLGYHYEIQPRGMVIEGWHSSEVLVSKCFVYDKSQKEIIYDAVVEFINEYNKTK